MMEIRTALKCFNQRKCRFLTPCFYVCKRPVSISVKRGFYARKIPLKVLNIGPTSFADELRAQNADVTQVAWKPIAGGNPELLGALASLDDAAIDAANQEALSRYLEGEPYLIDYSLAKDVIPGMEDHMLLHAGPPITWDRMCWVTL